MSMFTIPGSAFEGISALGSTPPAPGYHAVKIVSVERKPTDKPHTYRMYVQFENGFRMFDFLHLAYGDDSKPIPGLSDKQIGGRTAALLTVLTSLGFSHSEVSANGIDENWLLFAQNGGRQGYVEFTPGQKGVANSYSSIDSWVTADVFEAMKGKAPEVQAQTQVPAQAQAPAQAAQAPAPTAAIPGVPANGAGIPAQAVAAVPPSPAQTIAGK